MPKTELGYKHNLAIEVITPVAIGDGGTLSPLSDYTVNPENKNEALLLDHKQFEKALQNNAGYITDYVNSTKERIGKKKNDFLLSFIKDTLKEKEVDKFFKGKRKISGQENTVELKTCIKENGKPFIPGSTIKGAIKSAWLHTWLNNHPDYIQRIIEIIQNENAPKEAQRKIDFILNKLLDGRMTREERRMHFSTFLITDIHMPEQLEWYHTERYSLNKNKKANIPLFIEAIAPEATGEFQISVDKTTKHPSIKSLLNDSLETFFSQINRYSLDLINHEIDIIQNPGLESFKSFLIDLRDKITAAKNQYCYLPIGFGKGNFYQSIGLFIKKQNKEVFEHYIKLFKMGKKPNPGETYQKDLPLTRSLTVQNLLPMGWIMILSSKELRKSEEIKELKQGMQVEATVVSVGKPFSKVKIEGVDGLSDMTGTKEAKKNILFKENAIIQVKVNLNNKGEISQTNFTKVIQ